MKNSTLITSLAGVALAAFTLIGTAHSTTQATTQATAQANEAPQLTLENFIGTVDIVTQGTEISVDGAKSGTVSSKSQATTIDGGEAIKPAYCKSTNGKVSINIGKKTWFKRIGGYKNLNDYPKLDISVPQGTSLIIRDSIIFGSGESFGAVDASIKSCGSLDVKDIHGPLVLRVSGSGDFSADTVETANVKISGSGDVDIENVGPAVLSTFGSGDLEIGTLTGPAKISTTGSGDVQIETLTGDLAYEGRGSSDFSAGRVDGGISISVTGSGNVDIDDGNAPNLLISSAGSSEIDFGGEAQDAVISARGSSEIDVKSASGEIDIAATGSAEITVNGERYKD